MVSVGRFAATVDPEEEPDPDEPSGTDAIARTDPAAGSPLLRHLALATLGGLRASAWTGLSHRRPRMRFCLRVEDTGSSCRRAAGDTWLEHEFQEVQGGR